MKTGYRGTFVISWTQTEVDGIVAGNRDDLLVGSSWSWRGDAVRVDGPSDRLRLDAADGSEQTRKRAARMVHKLVGAAVTNTPAASLDLLDMEEDERPLRDSAIVVSDGANSYTATVIEVQRDAPPLLMFMDQLPPQGQDFWVVHSTLTPVPASPERKQGGVICFTPGTRIRTDDGDVPIEHLQEGARVQTKDNGLQQIEWMGQRRMTGARLFAMPWLRPIRISAGAFGGERPDEQLLVSPEHRMIVRGDIARDLFNEDSVLVAARDMINGRTIAVDHQCRWVTYVHLLLPRHEIIWANGVETESFHPASAPLSSLDEGDRSRLLQHLPDVGVDPLRFGPYARRNLKPSEAAILQHAA